MLSVHFTLISHSYSVIWFGRPSISAIPPGSSSGFERALVTSWLGRLHFIRTWVGCNLAAALAPISSFFLAKNNLMSGWCWLLVSVVGFLILFGLAGFGFWLVVFVIVSFVVVFVWLFGFDLLLLASSCCCCCCPIFVPVGCFPVFLLDGFLFGFPTSGCCWFGLVSLSCWLSVGLIAVFWFGSEFLF